MLTVDHSRFKLGKLAPRPYVKGKMLMLADYLDYKLLPPPRARQYWGGSVAQPCGMMLNDQLGDCTCAALGHAIQLMTANQTARANWPVGAASSPSELTVPDSAILKAYEDACGYVPGNPNTDQGGIIADVLDYWVKTGVGGHKAGAWVAIDPGNQDQVQIAIDLLGFVDIGVALPLTAQSQNFWSVVPNSQNGDGAPGSWGGHSIILPDHDEHGFRFFTWGMQMGMSYNWFKVYCDEAYGVIDEEWIRNNGKAPSGLAIADLTSDLNALKQAAAKHAQP